MRIWTVGHSTRSAEEFLSLVRSHDIDRIADVRAFPNSRRHPHFGRERLHSFLTNEGIDYRHFPALGGLRKPRPESNNGAWKNQSFRGYADYMQTGEFAEAIGGLLDWGNGHRVAVMCAEAVWWQCHRMLIADALLVRDVEVLHIMSAARCPSAQAHSLTAFARTEGRMVRYPALLETKADHSESK
jgi:uncharacterized protein (DUF488 family)